MWIYLLKSKSGALLALKHFKTMAELVFGTPLIKSLQTDWDEAFTKYPTNLGIVRHLICPYTSSSK